MFPTPIEKRSSAVQMAYKIALPIALIVWLLPLIAVALTSVRSAGDITAGNYWGWPSSFNLLENYTAIFQQTPIGQYILNSFKVTIPTVIGAVALSCMSGFALAVYRFKGNLLLFFMFIWNMVGSIWLLPALARFLLRPDRMVAKARANK